MIGINMLIQPDFPDHWKTLRFIRELDGDANGVSYLLRLWGHCQNQKQSSFDMPCYAIAGICRYQGSPGDFERILESCGYIKRDGDSVKILGFDEHNSNMVVKWKNGKHGGRPKKADSNNLKPVSVIENETETQSRVTNEVNKENKGNKEKKTKGAPPSFDWDKGCPPSLNTKEVRAAFTELEAYRRGAKFKKWGPITIKKNLNQFKDLGPASLIQAINLSISNGWQGVFVPNGSVPLVRHNDKNTMGDQDMITRLRENTQ